MEKIISFINKINYKNVIIGFLLVVFVLFMFIGITSFLDIKKKEKNNLIAESITGKSLPVGFSAIKTSDPKNSKNMERVAFLLNQNSESVILIEGPRLKLERQKNEVISNLQNSLQKLTNKSYSNLVEIKQSNKLLVEGKAFASYEITITHKKQKTKGIAAFFDYRKRTLCFIYLANSPDYKIDTAIEFLEYIKLPD